MVNQSSQTTLVLGGGPAGLTAGYLLGKSGGDVVVLEADDQVGGLAKTVERDGYRFDLGGHRFFTKALEVDDLWHEVLGDEFLRRPRMSRIYWNNRYLDYPLRGSDVIRKLGPVELTRCMASYLVAAARPKGAEESLEEWVTNRFGRRLFELFFKSYNEKVWGVPASEIRAEWAAQRIKGLSFFSAAKAAFFGNKGNKIKSLISEFNYPRYGPGQMWDAMTDAIRAQGGEVLLESPVTRLELAGSRLVEVVAGDDSYALPDAVISSLPLRDVVRMMSPKAPADVIAAANGLRYRDFLTVALVVDGDDLFPDNWIYIHEPGVSVGRIQNFKNWSPGMVPDPRYTVLGLEYFCFDSDSMWNSPDADLVALGTRELAKLGLATEAQVVDGTVVRQRAAYPVYDGEYRRAVDVIREFIKREMPNLQLVGRNGMHKYNNQDHAMMTGLMAARNIMGASYDLWRVNSDAQYLEEDGGAEQGSRMVPRRLETKPVPPTPVAAESVPSQ
jgi:protoporphyrinogen oxidase